MDPAQFIDEVSPPLDNKLVQLLITEFLDIERRYVLGDWEPTTLNGGQFAEIIARIVYHIDSGNLNRTKSVDKCLSYVEDTNNRNIHNFPNRSASLHMCRVIRTIYKFRSQRGAVHIDPDYTANELDSTLLVSLARWCISEILRIFWTGDTAIISSSIREIIRYEVPSVINIDNKNLVLRTDCSVEEEILLLLHNVGETGMDRKIIGQSIPKNASSVTRAIKSLCAAEKREIIQKKDGKYVLTPNGSKRIHTNLYNKLILI